MRNKNLRNNSNTQYNDLIYANLSLHSDFETRMKMDFFLGTGSAGYL